MHAPLLVERPVPDIDVAEAVELHRTMCLVRAFEERLLELRTGGEVVGPVHPYTGEEAIAVGVCAARRHSRPA